MNRIKQTYLLLCLLVLASCNNDLGLKNTGIDGSTLIAELQVSSSSDATRTRVTEPGEDALNENVINSLHIYLFNPDDGALYTEFSTSQSGVKLVTEGSKQLLKLQLSEELIEKLQDKSVRLVTIANNKELDATQINSYADLKKEAAYISELNIKQPENFLMTSELVTEPLDWSKNSTVKLHESIRLVRALAKIQLNIEKITISMLDGEGYTNYTLVGAPRVKLMNYKDGTYLLPRNGEGKSYASLSTEYEEMALVASEKEKSYVLSAPYYTTALNWENLDQEEPYMMVELTLKGKNSNGDEGREKPFYYKIPLKDYFQSGGAEEQVAESTILRNHNYKVVVDIHNLGSEEDTDPFELKPMVIVAPWIEEVIDGDIGSFHYLMVKENAVDMPNIHERLIEFVSDLPVKITVVKTQHEEYDTQGNKSIVTVMNDQHVVTYANIADNKKYIVVRSAIPKNFVPLDIYLNVKHDSSLSSLEENIKITQYPAKYITVSKSEGKHWNGDGHGGEDSNQRNFNFYKITTLTPANNEKIGDPTGGKSLETENSTEANQIISPQFIIASQRGITYTMSHRDATKRCLNYYESEYGPGKKVNGNWRLPTHQELELIDRLQDDPNSAVKRLLIGHQYWGAKTYYYYNFGGNAWYGGEQMYSLKGNTRCVFDTWKFTNNENETKNRNK